MTETKNRLHRKQNETSDHRQTRYMYFLRESKNKSQEPELENKKNKTTRSEQEEAKGKKSKKWKNKKSESMLGRQPYS